MGVNERKIKEIEEKIADLEGRWPSHSVPPGMWRELEELEEELEKAREGGADEADGRQAGQCGEKTPGARQADGRGAADDG